MISANGSTAPASLRARRGALAFGRMSAPRVIGVVGAGTMGSGIAQLGALSGARTLLFDADGAAVERALERIPAQLERGAERGRWSAEDAGGARERLGGAGGARGARRGGPGGRGRP